MQLPLPQRFTKANHPWPLEENKPNQTQFQNGQNEDKHGNSKGLCKSTTNNEQRTLSKTNPNKANPGAPEHNTRHAIRNQPAPQYAIRDTNPIKPNFKMGKMKISTEIVRVYANQQRTMNNERYPKQTQTRCGRQKYFGLKRLL